MASERVCQHAFVGVSALLFATSAELTIVWCASMSEIGEMPMPGDVCTLPAHSAGRAAAHEIAKVRLQSHGSATDRSSA
jgi:hypothetical protein